MVNPTQLQDHQNRPVLLASKRTLIHGLLQGIISQTTFVISREWISPAAVAYIAYRLLENAGAHLDMLNEYDFYLMPLVNPDG